MPTESAHAGKKTGFEYSGARHRKWKVTREKQSGAGVRQSWRPHSCSNRNPLQPPHPTASSATTAVLFVPDCLSCHALLSVGQNIEATCCRYVLAFVVDVSELPGHYCGGRSPLILTPEMTALLLHIHVNTAPTLNFDHYGLFGHLQ